jgi:hypothetical protein
MSDEETLARIEAGADQEAKEPMPRVTSIAAGRVYNLGNYENLRLDVSVEIPQGCSASETMLSLMKILQQLRPLKASSSLTEAQRVLKIPEHELSEYQKENLEYYRTMVNEHMLKVARRKEAMAKLDCLGGSSTSKDAKDSWVEDDYPDDD